MKRSITRTREVGADRGNRGLKALKRFQAALPHHESGSSLHLAADGNELCVGLHEPGDLPVFRAHLLHEKIDNRGVVSRRCRIGILVVVLTVFCSIVFSGSARAQSSEALLARELANPISNLISVPFVTNYDEGYGTGDGYRIFTNVQPLIPIELNEDWLLLSRTIIPIVWDQKDINPLGPSGHQSGFGDISESLWLSPSQATSIGSLGNFTWGAGAVALLPTGNADPLLGTGKWGLGPTAVGLFVKGGWTYGALTNHIWDVAGKNNRADVNVTLVQPFIAYTTPKAVTVALEAETTYDWVTDRWSVPINATVSKLTTIGKQAVSFEVGLRYWADNPPGAPDPGDLGYRFNVTFLFPN